MFTFPAINQAIPDQSTHTDQVKLNLTNTRKPLSVFVERIDADYANPKKHRMEIGEPKCPSAYEVDSLRADSELFTELLVWTYDQGTVHLPLSMLPQSAAAVTLELGVEGMQNFVPQMGAEKT